MRERVTMEDIAASLGITKSLVSKALGNKDGVSDAMRRKIISNAEKMGYMKKNTRPISQADIIHNVTVVIDNESFKNFCYWSKLIDGIVAELQRLNMNVYLNILNDDEQDILFEREGRTDPDGLILVGHINEDKARSFQALGVPIVWVDSLASVLQCDYIYAENFHAAYQMAELMAQKGHTEILFLGNVNYSISYSERYRGLATFAADHPELGLHITIVGSANPRYPYFENEQLVEVLTRKKRPSAIFACNDMAAMLAYKVIRELGLCIPGDVSMTGFDNMREYEDTELGLTSVNVSKIGLALEAVKTLIWRSHNPLEPYQWKSVKTDIVIRQSLGERKFQL